MATGTFMGNIFSKISDLILGKPERLQQVPRFTEPQQDIFSQLQQRGGEALPAAFDQLISILTQDPQAAKQFEAPALRQFEEQILPTIAERFTGALGEGSQRSSAFGQQLGQAGAGLAERLQAQRGARGGQALQQFMQLLGIGLTPQHDTLLRPRQPGLFETGAKGAAEFLPSLIAGGV